MAKRDRTDFFKDPMAIHHYYSEMLNAMPAIIYWIDVDCNLKGWNTHFARWLNIHVGELQGTPYDQMLKVMPSSAKRIEEIRLDDMSVLFSKVAKCATDEAPIENSKGDLRYYRATRVPLFDYEKNIIGLVTIYIDVTEERKVGPCLEKPVVKARKKRKASVISVLMVEDNVVAQKIEASLLESLDCNVDVAGSGDAALALFVPGKYDLVFMDIGLTDTSGYVVSRKIRQQEAGTKYHTPIVALTAYQANVVKYDCKDYAMNAVLTKPLTAESANKIIQHFLENTPIEIPGFELLYTQSN